VGRLAVSVVGPGDEADLAVEHRPCRVVVGGIGTQFAALVDEGVLEVDVVRQLVLEALSRRDALGGPVHVGEVAGDRRRPRRCLEREAHGASLPRRLEPPWARDRLCGMLETMLEPIPLAKLERRNCAKWTYFPEGVLPLWVAEMDLPIAEPIREAIKAQVDQHDLGSPMQAGAPGMCEALIERVSSRYGLKVPTDGVLSLSSTVTGINLAARAFSEPGDEVLLLTPLYPPFKSTLELTGRVPVEVEMVDDGRGYAVD